MAPPLIGVLPRANRPNRPATSPDRPATPFDLGLYSLRGHPPENARDSVANLKNRGQARTRSCGTRPKIDPPPAPLFRLIETDRASERRRPTPARTSATAGLFRDRRGRRDRRSATRREWFGLGVAGDAGERPTAALIRARTRKSLSRVRFPLNRTFEPTSPNDRV